MLRLSALRERLRASLWFVPMVAAAGAIVLALLLLAADHQLSANADQLPFLYGGTAEGARSMLSTIAQSMLTFTGLVFTITMLVLQLASSQLSPRVMRTFLRDRSNQIVLGLFVATFLYTLVVLRDVRAPVDGESGFVPGLSIWVAFALLLGSVGAFIYYIDHMAQAIRASTVIANIAAETEAAIDRLYPDRVGTPSEATAGTEGWVGAEHVLDAPRAGVVVGVDAERLLRSTTGDRHLELLAAVGDFVPSGAPMIRTWGTWDEEARQDVREAVALADERNLQQDASFGFRQLVDVAVRALSPGTNDPTTAVQALDRLHDLLRRLAGRDIPAAARTDADGRSRLLLPRPDWDDYVSLAVDEIRLSGQEQIQVMRRLRSMLEDLLSTVTDPRAAVLRREIGLVRSAVERSFPDRADAVTASEPSRHRHATEPSPGRTDVGR